MDSYHFIILLLTWTFSQILSTERLNILILSNRQGNMLDGSITDIFIKKAASTINEPNNNDTMLNFEKLEIDSENSYATYKQICKTLSSIKPISIVGPIEPMSLSHVKSISESLELPHLQYNWDYSNTKLSHNTINLYPKSEILSLAYLHAVVKWKWNDVIILYHNYTALIKLQSIIKEPPSETLKVRVINVNYMSAMRIMKMVKNMKWKNIIIDGSAHFTEFLLKTGLQLEMMNENYHYFLTVLDIDLLHLENYKYNGVKLNGFKITNFEKFNVYLNSERTENLNFDKSKLLLPFNSRFEASERFVKESLTEGAMLHDAILILAHSLKLASLSSSIKSPNISCRDQNPTEYGTSLMNYINSVEISGLTGPIKFQNGIRSFFTLELLDLNIKGLQKIGSWDPDNGISLYKTNDDVRIDPKMLSNKSFIITSILRPLIVTTILEKPYVMLSKCHYENSCNTENEHYEGFCIDMLNKIAYKLGFKYLISVVADGTYGAPDEKGEWSGMIRELMDNRADLAVAPLTINWLREQVIDFTKPFMSLGITILFKLPEKSKPGLFSFLNPLSFEIWAYVVAAYVGVSVMLFALSRFSPYEWVNVHPPCCVAQYLYNKTFNSDVFTSINGFTPVDKSPNSCSLEKNDKRNQLIRRFSFGKRSTVDVMAFLQDQNIVDHYLQERRLRNGTISTLIPFYNPNLVDNNQTMSNSNNGSPVDAFMSSTSPSPPLTFDSKNTVTKSWTYKKTLETPPSTCPTSTTLKNYQLPKLNIEHVDGDAKVNRPLNLLSQSDKGIVAHTPPIFKDILSHTDFYEPPIIENRFTLSNSFWFSLGTLMQQGSDISPSAMSTRLIGGFWWFFTLILISSYTANLAAFLTVEKMVSPIESAEDLVEQTTISYGTLASGSTYTFFKNAKVPLFQKMWNFMGYRSDVFTQTQDEGVKKVLEGNYAFFMESTTIDYIIQRNCNLTQIGGLLDSKGYGIGTHLGSPFRDPISLAILELQENGQITLLYNKWWKSIGVTCLREAVSKESKASELGLENVGGIFVVLLCGIACSLLVGFGEFFWKAKGNADVYKQSIWSQFLEELKYAVRCKGSRQRPRLKRHCSQCNEIFNNLHPAGLVERPNNESPNNPLEETDSSTFTEPGLTKYHAEPTFDNDKISTEPEQRQGDKIYLEVPEVNGYNDHLFGQMFTKDLV